jgi:uncharacterized membrane protein YkvA (DUF1232 family)
MAPPLDKLRSWIDSFAADVTATMALTDHEKVARDARLLGAAALNYLVTRLDLIPDWEESCGILDDAMVLRLAISEAVEKDIDALPADAQKTLHRLANEADAVRELLGDELHGKLKRYVHGLTNQAVRNRHPSVVVDDDKERGHLYAEIKDDLKRVPNARMSDPAHVLRIIKNYLDQKLK